MSYATFLVHAQADADGEARVRLAANLAKRFEAMLIGVSARAISSPITPPHAGMLVVELMDRQEREIAEEQAAAEHCRADLVVAGGYGHTRLQEWILGGVTRALIQRFPKCCLLSH